MSNIVNLSSVSERKGKLNKLYENLEELKNQFSEIIDEYEEEESGNRDVDTLIEALDALEDAAELQMCWKGDFRLLYLPGCGYLDEI